MASGWTDKGMYTFIGWALRGETPDTNLYVALCTDAATPAVGTNTFTTLTEVTAANGYTSGGIQLTRNSTDFDVWTEGTGEGYVQIKDLVWTASGGSISGARWAVLTDDNVTQASRLVYAWFDLVSNRTVTDGQTLTLQNCQLTIT